MKIEFEGEKSKIVRCEPGDKFTPRYDKIFESTTSKFPSYKLGGDVQTEDGKIHSGVKVQLSGPQKLMIEKNVNEIDINQMNSGVYFVNFKFKKSSIIKRIIISK
jgi:hypothetical protein